MYYYERKKVNHLINCVKEFVLINKFEFLKVTKKVERKHIKSIFLNLFKI